MNFKLISFLLFAATLISSCGKSGVGVEPGKLPPTEAELRLALEKMWKVNNVGSNFVYVEFADNGYYFITTRDGNIHADKYSIDSELKSITLNGIGELLLVELDADELLFTLKPSESTNKQHISCSPSNLRYEDKLLYLKGERRLYSCDLDGGNEKFLLGLSFNQRIADFSWHLDSKKIVYSIVDVANPDEVSVYLMDVDGSNAQKQPQSKSILYSPKADKLLYVESGNVFSCLPDGSKSVRITNFTPGTTKFAQAAYPTWSPNSRNIAYVALTSGGEQQALYLSDTTGVFTQVLASATDSVLSHPQFSYNERLVSYIVNHRYLMAYEIASRQVSQLLDVEEQVGPGMKISDQRWSPNGRSLYFTVANPNGESFCATVSFNGNGYKKVGLEGGSGFMPGLLMLPLQQ